MGRKREEQGKRAQQRDNQTAAAAAAAVGLSGLDARKRRRKSRPRATLTSLSRDPILSLSFSQGLFITPTFWLQPTEEEERRRDLENKEKRSFRGLVQLRKERGEGEGLSERISAKQEKKRKESG